MTPVLIFRNLKKLELNSVADLGHVS